MRDTIDSGVRVSSSPGSMRFVFNWLTMFTNVMLAKARYAFFAQRLTADDQDRVPNLFHVRHRRASGRS